MRLRLKLAYDGREFAGWQSQRSGAAVQDAVERELAVMEKRAVRIHGAGRTDSGVHALGQVAHVDVETVREPAAWKRALNARLPGSVRILGVRRVPDRFHARYDAIGKVYRYRIVTSEILMPLDRGTVWHLPRGLDHMRMCAALEFFSGSHDFSSFSANRGKPVKDARRSLQPIRISKRGCELRLTFDGTGFLYRMVRMLVGAAVKVGQGRAEPRWIRDLLQNPRVGASGAVAPADGLTLVGVRYD